MFFLKTRDRTNTYSVDPCGTPFNLSDPPMRSMPVMLLLVDLAKDLVMIMPLGRWLPGGPIFKKLITWMEFM